MFDWLKKNNPKEDAAGNSTEYKYRETPPEGVVMPVELAEKLPHPGRIEIISFSNGSNEVGRRRSMACSYDRPSEDYIQYCGRHFQELSYDERRAERIRLYADSPHPFFGRFTEDVSYCIENILLSRFELPSLYELSKDMLCVEIDSGYHDTGYKETAKYFCYRDSYSESYHDGGGSGLRKWYLYAAEAVECKTKLTEEIGCKEFLELPGFIHLPDCRGFWTENGHVYLVDPWGLPGIFEYYCHAEEQRDWDSDTEIWDVGIPIEN